MRKIFLFIFCFIYYPYGKIQASETADNLSPLRKLSLEQAIEISIERSPKLKAAQAELGISDAYIKKAKGRLNPSIISDNGLAEKTYRLGIEKTLELGSKRERRIELAEKNREKTQADIELLELNLRTEVRKAYTQLYIMQERYKCFQEIVKTTEKLLEIARKRELSGDIANLDTLQVEMTNLNAANELENTNTTLIEAQNKLNSLFNQDLDTVLELENPNKLLRAAQAVDLSPLTLKDIELFSLDNPSVLTKSALKLRPEMKQNFTIRNSNQSELRLAKASRIPNLSLTLGPDLVVNSGANDSFGMFIIGNMELPLLYQAQGEIQAAKAKALKLNKEKEDLENQIELEVSNAYSRVNANQAKLQRFETELTPKAANINEKSFRCFEEGKCPVIIAINAEQSLINTKLNHLNAIADYQNSIADLERAIGGKL